MLKVITFFLITGNALLFTQNLDNQIQLNIIEDIKLFHSPPEPLFTGRPFELSLVTELSESIIHSTLLFFKTDSMESFREINLDGENGLYKFKINTRDFPGNSIEYFFAVKTNDGRIYGAPVNDQNVLEPIKKVFLDPVKYYEQKQRLDQ
tara:strand:+ start:395 stop:844 length:450 start_codon:yes stop_codon:yes gene_type:complete